MNLSSPATKRLAKEGSREHRPALNGSAVKTVVCIALGAVGLGMVAASGCLVDRSRQPLSITVDLTSLPKDRMLRPKDPHASFLVTIENRSSRAYQVFDVGNSWGDESVYAVLTDDRGQTTRLVVTKDYTKNGIAFHTCEPGESWQRVFEVGIALSTRSRELAPRGSKPQHMKMRLVLDQTQFKFKDPMFWSGKCESSIVDVWIQAAKGD